MMFHWLLQLDWRTNWMLVALLLEKVTSLICRQEIGFFFSCFFFDLFNLFTPKISFLILLTVCHTVLMMLLFLYSQHLSACYCIDNIRRNSVLVTLES